MSFAYFPNNARMTPKTHSMHLVISYIPRTQLSQAVCTCYYSMSIPLLVEYTNENQSFHYSIMQVKAFIVTCYIRPMRIFLNRAEKQQNVILMSTMSLPEC